MLSNKLLVGIVLAIVVIYGLVEAYPLLAGPSITLSSPKNGAELTDPVAIAGVAHRAATLTLDGAPLTPDQDGSFSATLAFPSGTSILMLTARDRFGRTITITRTIVVD